MVKQLLLFDYEKEDSDESKEETNESEEEE